MPITINPIRKKIVKKSLLQGKSAIQALKDAGYSNATASLSTKNTVIKECKEEIENAIKYSDITPDYIMKQLEIDRKLAREKQDISSSVRVGEIQARSIKLLGENNTITNKGIYDAEETQASNRLASLLGNN